MKGFGTDEILKRKINFGDHLLDTLRNLGNPNKEFSRPRSGTKQALHFLNYLELGIDLGFSEDDHLLKKIILRSNHIADPIFGFYDRCFFQLNLDFSAFREGKEGLEESKDKSGGDQKTEVVTPCTKFSSIKPHLKKNDLQKSDLLNS